MKPIVTCARPLRPAILCLLLLGAVMASSSPAREVESFDGGWRFHPGDAAGAEAATWDDAGWRLLDLPHDWSIEGPYDEHASTGGPGGYLPTGIGWYRKTFELPAAARKQSVRLRFDGIYEHSTVWLNGHLLGQRPYGYSTFEFDLAPYLKWGSGPNVVAVRVDNSSQPNSRWYSGSGIFRHTWLTIENAVHVAPWGVAVTTPEMVPGQARVSASVTVRNDGAAPVDARLQVAILDEHDSEVAALGAQALEAPGIAIAPNSEAGWVRELVVTNPHLWAPHSPHLYRLRCRVFVGSAIVDETSTTFGIRSIIYDTNRGLLLNGVPVKLKGVCLHHDGGAVGAAVPEAVLERRLRLLLEMGCNAIRTSHNPMAPEFYDLCDRLGLLVLDEAFDEWTVRKPQIKFGYSDIFAEWSERDLVTMIRRDRNHPSIILWSAGNEIGEQWSPEGPAILGRLVDIFHREDPTRPVTAAMDNIFNQNGPAPRAFPDRLDIVGYNYGDRWGTRRETVYADDRHDFPQRKILGTEDTSARGTRGEYRFGSLLGGAGDDEPASGPRPVGATYLTDTIHAASMWRFIATHDYVIGDFIWTGFDYLGESRWPVKLSADGPLDTCGFKKDSFYFYQSIWTDRPMVHLLPHWNWPERAGKTVPVVAYSNCVVVELFLNGRSLGAKAHEFPAQGAAGGWNSYALPTVLATTADMQLAWDVPYEPGELRAVGYDREGKPACETVVRTAGSPARLEATVDRRELVGDGRDVAHVTVRALDANGAFVPLADNVVHFELSGPGRLLGVDNGDPVSHASYQAPERALFHGMALALIQSRAQAGNVTLTAATPGLPSVSIALATRPSP